MWWKRRIWIIALFCITFSVSSVLSCVYTYSEKQFRISNYFLSEKAVAFSGKNLARDCYDKIEEDFVIYNKIEQSSDEWMKFAYYANGNVKYPQLISGRFFESQDYETSEKLVVVGQDVLREGNIVTKGEKRYLISNGDSFLILGVMGYNFSTVLDRTVFFNMGSVEPSHLYYLDSAKKKTVLKVWEQINQQSRVMIVQSRESEMNNLVDLDIQMQNIIGLLLGVNIASMVLAVFFYIKEKTQEIYVKKLLGVSMIKVLAEIGKSLFLHMIIAVLVGIVSYGMLFVLLLRPNSVEGNEVLLFIFYGGLWSVAGIMCMLGTIFQYVYKQR